MSAPSVAANQAPAEQQSVCAQDSIPSGSRVDSQKGCVETGFAVPMYSSRGQAQRLAWVYRSQRAFPEVRIAFDLTLLQLSATPQRVSYQALLSSACLWLLAFQ